MSVNCSLHRSKAAHFECHQCGSTLCDDCISIKETPGLGGKNRDYFCPACEWPANMIGLGNVMEPFWNRLSSIFLYPFQLTPLILTFILSALGAFFPGNIFVQLAVWVIMMKYAYAALIFTAQGALKAPDVTWKLLNEDVLQVFKQFAVFFLIGVGASFIFGFSMIAGIIFAFVMIGCLPAIIMVLVSTNSVFQAVNPFVFIPIITRIGWPYVLMYLFLFFLFGAPAALFAFLPVEAIPVLLLAFLSLFFSQLYSIISYHLMGYVLLQYHEEIGYSVDYEFFVENQGDKKKRKEKSPEEEAKTGLALLVKAGKYPEAIQRVLPLMREDNPEFELSEKFYQLLKMAGEDENAAIYSAKHLDVLVRNNKRQKAMELFPEIKASSSAPPSPESVFNVASWYEERNDPRNALSTYGYFTKNFKNHSLTPEVYYYSAKILYDKANNSKKAKQILKAIIRTFPDHEIVPEAKEYLARVT